MRQAALTGGLVARRAYLLRRTKAYSADIPNSGTSSDQQGFLGQEKGAGPNIAGCEEAATLAGELHRPQKIMGQGDWGARRQLGRT
mmetsp:Transcript_29974/g.65372  ORF Transcript_29974/g.65372 Transcript_29974/m.65372 type:complete len:86 (+) Transcript_29974:134-391(+)